MSSASTIPISRSSFTPSATGSSFPNFNLSVGATDEFLAAVESWRVRASASHGPARDSQGARPRLFDDICESAWATGDPGLIFLDTIARTNPLPACGEIESTNPCGEVAALTLRILQSGFDQPDSFCAAADGRAAWTSTASVCKSTPESAFSTM